MSQLFANNSCDSALKGLKQEFPGAFEDPKIQPLLELDWDAYLSNKKKVTDTNLVI